MLPPATGITGQGSPAAPGADWAEAPGWVVPRAASVATVPAMAAAEAAMTSERTVASWTAVFCQAMPYQRHEKPPQTAIDSEPLKE